MLILKRAYEHFDPFGLKCGRTSARTYNKDNNDAIRSSFCKKYMYTLTWSNTEIGARNIIALTTGKCQQSAQGKLGEIWKSYHLQSRVPKPDAGFGHRQRHISAIQHHGYSRTGWEMCALRRPSSSVEPWARRLWKSWAILRVLDIKHAYRQWVCISSQLFWEFHRGS